MVERVGTGDGEDGDRLGDVERAAAAVAEDAVAAGLPGPRHPVPDRADRRLPADREQDAPDAGGGQCPDDGLGAGRAAARHDERPP